MRRQRDEPNLRVHLPGSRTVGAFAQLGKGPESKLRAAGASRRPPPQALPGKPPDHPLEATGQHQDLAGRVRIDDADDAREVDGTDDLVQRVVRDLEVPPPHPRAVARQPLAQPQERTLARPRRLIPQLSIPNPSL